MKYLKLFNTNTEYETYMGGGEVILPNVSFVTENNEMFYNAISSGPVSLASLPIAEGFTWSQTDEFTISNLESLPRIKSINAVIPDNYVAILDTCPSNEWGNSHNILFCKRNKDRYLYNTIEISIFWEAWISGFNYFYRTDTGEDVSDNLAVSFSPESVYEDKLTALNNEFAKNDVVLLGVLDRDTRSLDTGTDWLSWYGNFFIPTI